MHYKRPRRISKQRRMQILFGIDPRCGICGGEILVLDKSINLDHIVPKSKGGKGNLSNLQLAHKPCNEIKKDNWATHTFEQLIEMASKSK